MTDQEIDLQIDLMCTEIAMVIRHRAKLVLNALSKEDSTPTPQEADHGQPCD